MEEYIKTNKIKFKMERESIYNIIIKETRINQQKLRNTHILICREKLTSLIHKHYKLAIQIEAQKPTSYNTDTHPLVPLKKKKKKLK